MSDVSRVPAPLHDEPIWLCYAEEPHPDPEKDKLVKVPYYVNGSKRHGVQGTEEDRAELVTMREAIAVARRHAGLAGVAIAVLPEYGLCILDIDKCVRPDGSLPPEIAAMTRRTYSEWSPSGTGVHIFFKGNLGNRRREAKGGRYGVDIFGTNGYLTMTGNMVAGSPCIIADLDEAAKAFCEDFYAQKLNGTATDLHPLVANKPALQIGHTEACEALAKVDPYPRDVWRNVGFACHHQWTYGDLEDAFDLWDEWSSHAGGIKYPGTAALRDMWDKMDADRLPPVTFASVINYGKTDPADPETYKVLRDALVRPDPMEVFKRIAPEPAFIPLPGDAMQSPTGYDGRFPVTSILQSLLMPPMQWFIRNLFPMAEVGMVYGASGVGKTFMVLDMVAHIALGLPWHGHRVKQGRVAYVLAEGQRAFGQRLQALCTHYGIDPADLARNFGLINFAPDLGNDEEVDFLIASIKAAGGADVVVLDTLARVVAGRDENSGMDMGKVIANIQRIHGATGATVLIIHHPGKDLSLGSRGWSGIRAAMDFQILLMREEGAVSGEVRLAKMKDGDDTLRLGYRLDLVELGYDDEGEPITSRVVAITDAPPPSKIGRRGIASRSEMAQFLIEYVASLPVTISGLSRSALIAGALEALPEPLPEERDTRRFRIAIALDELVKEGHHLIKDGESVLFMK